MAKSIDELEMELEDVERAHLTDTEKVLTIIARLLIAQARRENYDRQD